MLNFEVGKWYNISWYNSGAYFYTLQTLKHVTLGLLFEKPKIENKYLWFVEKTYMSDFRIKEPIKIPKAITNYLRSNLWLLLDEDDRTQISK